MKVEEERKEGRWREQRGQCVERKRRKENEDRIDRMDMIIEILRKEDKIRREKR